MSMAAVQNNKRNSPVHLHLTRNEGLEVRSVVYFDDLKINRVILLENQESRAEQRLAAADDVLTGSLADYRIAEVFRKSQQIDQLHAKLNDQINDLFGYLGPLLKEE